MTTEPGTSSASRRSPLLIAAILAFLVIAGGLGALLSGGGEAPETVADGARADPVRPVVEEVAPETATPDRATSDAAPPEASDVAEAEEALTPPVEELTPEPPRFDVVRVDPAGGAVIAGQAEALSTVTLTLDGEPIEVTQADTSGNFVALLALAPSDAPRVLSVEATLEDGAAIAGAETVIIAPFTGDLAEADTRTDGEALALLQTEAAPAPAAPDAETDTAATETRPAPDAETAEAEQAAPEAPSAPAVLLADEDGIRVLQAPDGGATDQIGLQLDAITYDTEGEVQLAGRGPAEADLRVTLDNEPIQLGEVSAGGDWSLTLPDVDPGTYTLRVEELAADGSVTRNIETPFLREDPERLAANPMLAAPGAEVITVQPGFTLWGIAQANFGDGILYVQLFEENRGAIRDPDLIFPGQIFRLPNLPRGE